MRQLYPAIALCAFVAVAPAAHEQPAGPSAIVDTSFVTADGARTLQESIDIDAPAAVLWKAYTDPTEFKRWNAPVVAIDLRVGGAIEASYDPAKPIGDPDTIKNRILTFLPGRLIVFQNTQAPRALPGAEAFQRTVTVLEYLPLGPARTRVTISSTGWGTDAASDRLYGFFKSGNAQLLAKLKAVYGAAK